MKRLTQGVTGTARLLVVGLVVALAAGATGAVAGQLITSKDIRNGSIKGKDIKSKTIAGKKLTKKLRKKINKSGTAGAPGQAGATGPEGPQGAAGADAEYVGPNWSLIDRNTIGSSIGALRAGPSSGTTIAPPLGIGSLGLQTKDGTEKVAFGNSVDFVGDLVGDLDQLGYWWFQTGEDYDKAPGNGPNLTFEIDPSVAGRNYTSMVYVPAAPPSQQAEQWIDEDADANPGGGSSGWYFTNGLVATATLCGQGGGQHLCSLSEAQNALVANNDGGPPASIGTVALAKGRDYEYEGAADALRINDTVYDFEPFGVSETTP